MLMNAKLDGYITCMKMLVQLLDSPQLSVQPSDILH